MPDEMSVVVHCQSPASRSASFKLQTGTMSSELALLDGWSKHIVDAREKLIESRLDVSPDLLAETTYEIPPRDISGIMEGSRNVTNLNHNMHQNDKGYVSVWARGKHYYLIPRRKALGGAV